MEKVNKEIFWYLSSSGKYIPETKKQALERIERVKHLIDKVRGTK